MTPSRPCGQKGRHLRIACIETTQFCRIFPALWVAGELALGPLYVGEGEPFGPQGSPICQLLARLGVEHDGYRDEFETVGLGRHRETADWLP